MPRLGMESSNSPLSPPHRARTRGAILALLIACLGEALSFPLMKAFGLRAGLVAPEASGWFVSATLLAGRFLFGALALCLVVRARLTREEVLQGALIGGFAAIGHVLQTDGLSFTEASTSAFLTQGYVVVLPLLSAIEAQRWPERRVGIAVTLNLLGLAILARFDPRTMTLGRGEAETLLAACAFAGQIYCISRARWADNRAMQVTLAMFVSTGGLSLLIAAVSGTGAELARLSGSPELWWLLGFLTCASTLVPFLLMNRFQRHVSASEAGVIYGAEPLLAGVLALFLPALLSRLAGVTYANETISPRLLVGALLITLATLVLRVTGPAGQADATT
jgi:drug/metabolite transporter (DMT)-like permease